MPASTDARPDWKNLFQCVPQGSVPLVLALRVLERGGRPFLVLTGSLARSARALDLYPAQTAKARLIKTALRIAWRTGLPVGLKSAQLAVDPHCPFSDYLAQQVRQSLAGSGATPGSEPASSSWAMLSGNAATAGQRCIFLLFDASGSPVAVVKAGTGSEAVRLVRHEIRFLRDAPAALPGIPHLRSEFESGSSAAFAVDFMPGRSPAGVPSETIERLLTSWVHKGSTCRLQDLAPWQKLTAACEGSLPSELQSAAVARVDPVVYHGDFAPWNIKETEQGWTVLDWERGELRGVPAWDWFHYVVQRAVLVERLAAPELTRTLRALLVSPAFQRYARASGIQGLENRLVTAYLEYVMRVIRPSEGLEVIQGLRAAWPTATSANDLNITGHR